MYCIKVAAELNLKSKSGSQITILSPESLVRPFWIQNLTAFLDTCDSLRVTLKRGL